MPIAFPCPNCGKRYSLNESMAGKKAKCKDCQTVFTIPQPGFEDEPDASLEDGLFDDVEDESAAHVMMQRGRQSQSEGGLALAAWIGLGAGGVGIFVLVLGMMFMGGSAERQPVAEREKVEKGEDSAEPAPSLLDRVTGRDPATDASTYPGLGPLIGPLLPPPAPRDTSAFEAQQRRLVQFIGQSIDALASVPDAASLQAAANQNKNLQDQVRAELGQTKLPFRPTAAEQAIVMKRLAPDIRREIERARQESLRISGLPGLGIAGTQLLGNVTRLTAPLEQSLKQAEAFNPATGALPYAEVYVKIANEDAEAVCRSQLKLALDESNGMQWANSKDWKKASFRVWPVPNALLFSRKIKFGKVVEVKDKSIFVIANDFSADEVAAAKEALKPAPTPTSIAESNDPKAPADADDLTKILFQLRSSVEHTRNDAVNKLKRYKNTSERQDEVTAALIPFLEDKNGFFVDDVMQAMRNWKTDETIPQFIKMLDHPESWVRDAATKMLGTSDDPRAVEPLVRRINSELNAEGALRKLGAELVEPALIEALKNPDPAIRGRVCDLLRDLGGKETLLAMLQMPADKDPGVRARASNAMSQIKSRVGPVELPKKTAIKPTGKKP